MKLTGKFEYLGIETIKNTKEPGKVFHRLALMQDMDLTKMFIDDEQAEMFKDYHRLEQVVAELEIVERNTKDGPRTYVSLLSVEKANKIAKAV